MVKNGKRDSINMKAVHVHTWSHLGHGKAAERVVLECAVEIAVKELEGNADVIAEDKPLADVDEVVCVVLVVLADVLQDLDLNLSLLVETSLVTNNLEREELLRLVVVRANNVSKRPLAKTLDNLKAEANMVVLHKLVSTLVVIVPAVGSFVVSRDNLLGLRANKIHLRELQNLHLFERREEAAVFLQGLLR